jgi:hypothetical protein
VSPLPHLILQTGKVPLADIYRIVAAKQLEQGEAAKSVPGAGDKIVFEQTSTEEKKKGACC